MKHISIEDFKNVLRVQKNDRDVDFIDVRTSQEYDNQHIDGMRNVPLSTIHTNTKEFASKKTIYLICGSGGRSQSAITKLEQCDISTTLVNVDGGISAWNAYNKKGASCKNPLPMPRQIFIATGSLILIGSFGTLFIHQYFSLLIIFIGIGLIFSGITGWCGMALVISRMPWNK